MLYEIFLTYCFRYTMKKNYFKENWSFLVIPTWWISLWMCTKTFIQMRFLMVSLVINGSVDFAVSFQVDAWVNEIVTILSNSCQFYCLKTVPGGGFCLKHLSFCPPFLLITVHLAPYSGMVLKNTLIVGNNVYAVLGTYGIKISVLSLRKDD